MIVLGSCPKATIERVSGTLNCAKDHSELKYFGSIPFMKLKLLLVLASSSATPAGDPMPPPPAVGVDSIAAVVVDEATPLAPMAAEPLTEGDAKLVLPDPGASNATPLEEVLSASCTVSLSLKMCTVPLSLVHASMLLLALKAML